MPRRRPPRTALAALAIAAALCVGAVVALTTSGSPAPHKPRGGTHTAPSGPPTSYPAGVEAHFVSGCEHAGSLAVCSCALHYFEGRVPLRAFVAYGTAVARGRHVKRPQWDTDAVRACVLGQAAAPSTEDAAAQELAHTAQVAIETLGARSGGSYASADHRPSALAAYEVAIRTAPAHGEAYLSSVVATADSYTLTTTSASGDTFSIQRTSRGVLTRLCSPSHGSHGDCVNGSW